LNGAAFFEKCKGSVPEFQVQDVGFAREEIVVDAEAVESAEMGVDNGGGDDFTDLGGVAVPLFDFLQRAGAEFEARLVFFEEMRDASVEFPAVVVEFGRGGEGADFGDRFCFEVLDAEDDVGDLNAGVVDVILHFDAAAGVAKEAREGVAEDGVAEVADVGGLVGIDAGVLDDGFGRIGRGRDRFLAGLGAGSDEKGWAVEKGVQVAAAGNFDAGDPFDGRERVGDFLREHARGFFQALGELEADRRGGFAHDELGRARGDHRDVGLVAFVDVVNERFSEAFFDGFVQAGPL